MTNVDHDKHMVVIYGIRSSTLFPDLDQPFRKRWIISSEFCANGQHLLERVVAYLPEIKHGQLKG